MPYLHSHDGAIFRDEKAGDFTVTINSPEAKKALDTYIELAKKSGPPNPGSYGQAQVIQALLTGKAAHATPVIAAWPQVDDPNKSAVVGKINVAVAAAWPGRQEHAHARPLHRRHSEEHPEGSPSRRARVPALVPDPQMRRSSTRKPDSRRSARTSTTRRS